MGGIKVGRWLAGGIAAALVIFVLEGILSVFYVEEMTAALEAVGISFEMTPLGWVLPILMSLLSGCFLVFLYAAARPRFGPGPKTAMMVATAACLGSFFPTLMGYAMIGLYPTGMLLQWAVQGLVEWNLAALVGGWVYREPVSSDVAG